jgi:hypothetical protein
MNTPFMTVTVATLNEKQSALQAFYSVYLNFIVQPLHAVSFRFPLVTRFSYLACSDKRVKIMISRPSGSRLRSLSKIIRIRRLYAHRHQFHVLLLARIIISSRRLVLPTIVLRCSQLGGFFCLSPRGLIIRLPSAYKSLSADHHRPCSQASRPLCGCPLTSKIQDYDGYTATDVRYPSLLSFVLC